MNELLLISSGWLGYLERWPVLLQILVTVVPVLLLRVYRQHLPGRLGLRRHPRLWTLAAMAAANCLLAAAGIPIGLAMFFALVYAGWISIGAIRHGLESHMNPRLLQQIDSGLVRPLFVLGAGLELINRIDNLDDLALIPLGSWFGTSVNFGQAFNALLTLYLLLAGSGPLAFWLALVLGRLLNLTPSSRRALSLVLRYLVVGVGVAWALDHLGFNRTALLAIAGGLSVGLGFGVKEVFANFISGLWLLFEGSVRPGEVLCIDDEACEVRRLGLRAALVWRDRDNTELLIPNQVFLTSTTVTFTGSDGMRRCQVEISAAYRHAPRQVMALLVQTALAVPGVLAEPAPVGLTLMYGESCVDYALRFWIADPMQGSPICSAVRAAIWEAFKANGLEIPYPQRIVHLEEGPPGRPSPRSQAAELM